MRHTTKASTQTYAVMTALEDAKDGFQPGWDRLYEAFRVAVFHLLNSMPGHALPAGEVSRVLVTYETARDDIDVDFLDDEDDVVDLDPPEELTELLRTAHGYLNFSTFMADFRAD